MNTKLQEAIKFLAQFIMVIMHKAPHLDEIVAYYLLKTYGGLNVPIRFVDTDIIGTEADHDRNGALPIGCGESCRFNEHRKGIERMNGQCATTLVAEFLGISDRPEIKRLIEEVLKFDTESGCPPTHLAELVKVANRAIVSDYNFVVNWVSIALKAVIQNEQYPFVALLGEKNLVDFVKAIDADGKHFSEDKRVREHIFRIAHDSMRRSDRFILELAPVLKNMQRLPYGPDVIGNWIETPLMQITADQIQFLKLSDQYEKREMVSVRTLDDRGEFLLKLLVIESDDLQAPRAARYAGADIVLCRNSKGNVMISIDTRIPDISLSNVIRMIRWMDIPKNYNGVEPSWLDLGVPGAHELPVLAHWYYFKKAEQIFNGSQTHSAPPTKIPTRVLVEAIMYGLHPDYTKRWCNDRGIIMNPKRYEKLVKSEHGVKVSNDLACVLDSVPVTTKL